MALTDYELVPAVRRVLNLFLLVDTSGSMCGEKIAAVNDAIRNTIPILEEIDDSNADAEIKVSVLNFNSSCSWLQNAPVALSDFSWSDLSAGGWTAMGEACSELSHKMSRTHGFLNSPSGSYAPVVIMLSDGAPTDDFEKGIAELCSNNWFKHSTRIAIAIGNDACIDTLKTFTGNIELVLRVHNIDALKTAIKVAVVTSSQIASRSSSVQSASLPGPSTMNPGVSGQQVTPCASSVSSKQQLIASAIAEETQGTGGLDIGDEALISNMDFDEFD